MCCMYISVQREQEECLGKGGGECSEGDYIYV
jgi:hypothetical protein